MKKLLFMLLLMTMAVTFAIAQQPNVILNGHVLNQQTGNPVAGQTMYISVDSLNYPGYYNQVLTDETGFYTDQIPYIQGTQQGQIFVSTADCNGMMASGTASFYPGVQEVTIDFNICGNPATGCVASFRYVPSSNDMLTFSFIDASYTMPGSAINSWVWDFGDGNTSAEQNPVHTYAQPGFYNTCLYISSNDSSCSSSFCMPVEADSTYPVPCDNYFSYFPDSSGTGYTFEGWAMNGQAYSYLWDFGDGTSGSGQVVTHVFADPSLTYNVCLTTTGMGPDSLSCTAISCQEVFIYVPYPCESSFGYYPDSTSTGYIFEGWTMSNQVDSWSWDFGDGTSANGQVVTHSFTDPGAFHNVCLTTTGTGINGEPCVFISCQEVYIYIPSPCESSFWYYPDSTGSGFTFEGWAMNNQVDSWTWDFGDGTSAEGQTVSHSYADPNVMYTACLTTTGTGPDGVTCSFTSCQEVYIYIPSPCENYFEAVTSDSNTYFFTGHLFSGAPADYFWDFGDGSTASGQQVTHTFQDGMGTVFNVCLTTFTIEPATNDSCMSTSCQVIFPGGGGSSCKAIMSAIPDSSGYTFNFQNLSQGEHSFIFWDFGDGEQSTVANPIHTYTSPGIYFACLTIGDSLNNCWDQTCQEIWVNAVQPGCQASFFAFPADSIQTSLNYMFINTSAPDYSNQQWSFGDGTTSFEPNPAHVYANPGIYTACLTIWDTIGVCQSTTCMEIFAGEATGNNTISGVVLAGNTLADQGIVWLIGANNYYYAETLIDSAGTYNFGGVPAGSYYIYAMLTPGSPVFFDYLPTYYASSLTWQGATIVTTGEPNAWYPISLVSSMYWSQGNAGITGTINWGGTFKSGGTPAANVEIVLFNSTGLPIAYTFSDSDGNFAFSNLPYGEYTLHAEMTGKTTETVVVILTVNATTASINFVITANAISALGNEGPDAPELMAGNPYPNPVGETLYLELNAFASGPVVVEILDLQGRIILSERKQMASGSSRISVATGNLTKGLYLLRVSTEGREPLQRKFVK